MRKIILIGDSTIDDNTCGWGKSLNKYVKYKVINLALSGRSTKSFINEGHWKNTIKILNSDDYLIIQFGHNDQKLEDISRGTNPFIEFKENLLTFVNTAIKLNAKPILVTPVERRVFNDEKKIENTLEDYPLVVRNLAKELNIPLIDLQKLSSKLYTDLGLSESKKLFIWYDGDLVGKPDNTHFNDSGSRKIAKLVASELNNILSK